ncbi:MAG: glycosyltransferase family A protein [Candidatus Bathyarchaeia archaeon]
MRILVAIPLGSAYAPVLENLIKFRGEHELSLAFLIADSNEEAISFAKNLNPEIMGRFNKIYRLIYEDRGWILENLSSARNFALEFAREKGFDALLFLDSDVRPPPDALENLLNIDSPIASGFCKFRVFIVGKRKLLIHTLLEEVVKSSSQKNTLKKKTRLE